MRTAHLPILRASMVIPPDISISGGWCPYVIKFKQVNCDCHQMSLAGVSCLMSGVGASVQFNAWWVLVTRAPLWIDRQT